MQEKELFKEISKAPKLLSVENVHRTIAKVWSAYTKFIRSLLSTHKSAVSLEFGKFIPTAQGAYFIPNASLLSAGPFNYSQNSMSSQAPEHFLSYSSISVACGYSKAICMNSIKEIQQAAIKFSKTSEVRLDFKVGVLVLRSGMLSFNGGLRALKANTAEESARTPLRTFENEHAANPNSIGHFKVIPKRNLTVPPPPEMIPWPYLSGFYEGSNQKPGKKLAIEESLSPMQLLEEHKRQIAGKQVKKDMIYAEETRDGQILAKVANFELKNEKEKKRQKTDELKHIFVESNKTQIESHRQEQDIKKTEKKAEKYDFFPFVYGSKLEEYQKQLKDNMKEELKAKLASEKLPERKDIPESYLTSFPIFLKQDKAIPSRRLDNTHVKAVMGQALSRYEQELQSLKANRSKTEKEQQLSSELQAMVEKQNKEMMVSNIQENNKFVLQQISDKQKSNQLNKERARELIKTHLGPEESPERIENERNRAENIKRKFKEDIVEQMKKKQSEMESQKLKDMKTEEANAMALVRDWEATEYRNEIKNRASKNLNKEAWERQMQIKNLQKNLAD